MHAWWNGLTALNQVFYCVALFLSAFFVWQMVAAFLGLDAGDLQHGEVPPDDASGADAAETMHAFELLSIRSVITFLTLFSWGSALYLSDGQSVGFALGISCVWGAAGMAVVALVLYAMRRLVHTGTQNLASAVGGAGKVYLNIAAGGEGEVRVEVGGILTHVRARAADGCALKAGAPVVVTRVIGANLLEVRPAE